MGKRADCGREFYEVYVMYSTNRTLEWAVHRDVYGEAETRHKPGRGGAKSRP